MFPFLNAVFASRVILTCPSSPLSEQLISIENKKIIAPSFKIGTIDIGDRQKGRIKATSVISCSPDKISIKKAFTKLYSKDFQNLIKKTVNPYGKSGASANIVSIIRSMNFKNIIKKQFYDLRV